MNALLTPSQFRSYITGLSRATTYRLIREGRIRTIKTGERDYLIPKQELADFVLRELDRQDCALQ